MTNLREQLAKEHGSAITADDITICSITEGIIWLRIKNHRALFTAKITKAGNVLKHSLRLT